MARSKYYITCAIPYVNAAPHIGHALEFVQGDVIARYRALLGLDTLLLSGGDENALKNVQAAEKAGKPIQEFIDENTQKFHTLTEQLHCRFDVWQKGSDQNHHFKSCQKLWNLCKKDIYKKSYEGLYCVGCEAFYTKEELNADGECAEHPGKKLETIKEENYFFKLSAYQERLQHLIENNSVSIVPQFRKNEILSFLKQPLKDISISRSNARAKNWGVPVPDDDSQRMYVWFDALNIYQSGVGFGWDDEKYKKWWPADVHVIGKGISRFHAVYWIAFLLSAGLEIPKTIFIHEYFTVNGQKMSKTLGNVIDPMDLIQKYGAESLRYYFLAKFSPFSDSNFSEEDFKKTYNADLANGLGNLAARITSMINQYSLGVIPSVSQDPESHPLISDPAIYNEKQTWKSTLHALDEYKFNEAMDAIWGFVKTVDTYINNEKPWLLAKSPEESEHLKWVLYGLVDALSQLSWLIQPFLPETSLKIATALHIDDASNSRVTYKHSYPHCKAGITILPIKNLFPRIP